MSHPSEPQVGGCLEIGSESYKQDEDLHTWFLQVRRPPVAILCYNLHWSGKCFSINFGGCAGHGSHICLFLSMRKEKLVTIKSPFVLITFDYVAKNICQQAISLG